MAKGIYRQAAGNQNASFVVGPNVAIYGGFSGGETSRDARDPATHVTILSGDIDNNDTGSNGVDSDSSNIVGSNSHQIVVMSGSAGVQVTASTVLDGFTLTGGDYANTANPAVGGGALECVAISAGNECSPTLARLVFSGNRAYLGGAMALEALSGGLSSPTLTNVTFIGNRSTQFGGALYVNAQLAGTSSPVLTNVTFSGNSSASNGGAIFNDLSTTASSSLLTNVTFNGNSAVNGGAIYNNIPSGSGSSSRLTNVTFYGNSASANGGAIYTRASTVTSPILVNATFNGNSAALGPAIYNAGANVLLLNSILWGDIATPSGPELFVTGVGVNDLSYSIIQGGCASLGAGCGLSPNYAGDPKLGALANNGGFSRTLMPGPGSAAINAVPCTYSNEMPIVDQRGAVRPDSTSAGPTRCDIGAVEANSLGSSPWDDL